MTSASPKTWEQAVQWLREQPRQGGLVKACYFDDPLLDAVQRFHLSAEWQAVKALFSAPMPGQTALDVGAGRGIASYALAKDGWLVTALEPDSSALVGAEAIREVARQSELPIAVVQEWGEKLPFADASFDVIHARQVLHHAHNLPALCSELGRVLKPGGMLVATREHVLDTPDCLPYFLASHPLHALYGGENAFTVEQYLDALLSAGLLVQQVLGSADSPINYFPTLEEDLFSELRQAYPWEKQNDAVMLRHWARRFCPANDYLYAFVARGPQVNERVESSLASRLVCIEARMDAQTRALTRLRQSTGSASHTSASARLQVLKDWVPSRVKLLLRNFVKRGA